MGRRDRESGAPAWVWGVGAAAVGVTAVVVLGLVLAGRAPEHADPSPPPPPAPAPAPTPLAPPAPAGRVPETWVRGEHAASGTSWEFPHTGELTPTSATVRLADGSALAFTVTIKDVTDADRRGPDGDPLTRLRGQIRRTGDPAVVRTGTVDGRPFVVRKYPHAVSLFAADAGRSYVFAVDRPDHDPGGARVRRFFDSVRIAAPPPPEPGAPSGADPAAPPAWVRQAGPGGFSFEMPPGKAWASAGIPPMWEAHAVLPLPERKTIQFMATVAAAGAGDPPGAAAATDREYQRLAANPKGYQPVRRFEVGGRPGYVAARAAGATGSVQMVLRDGMRTYTLAAHGPGVTADTPEVRRFFGSAAFAE